MTPSRRALLLLTAALTPPLALRAALLLGQELAFSPGDLRGVAGDLAVAWTLAVALGALLRWSRAAVAAALGLWTLACFANYEHVLALDANAALSYAGYLLDPTFLAGSVSLSAPDQAIALAVVMLGLTTTVLRGGRANLASLPAAGIAALLLALQAFWPQYPQTLRWRQDNVLIENLRSGAAGPAPASLPRPPADLSGTPRIPLDRKGSNVLLLVLEGVSGAHLPSVAAAQGYTNSYRMLHLDQLAREGVTYSNFVALQRQTNRGLYALLCGDLPRLGTGAPRMSEYAVSGGPTCLPQVLSDAGYRTVFLQAAPLAFMMKDQFMPRAGFQRTIGAEFFDRAYSRSSWGVDDVAFLEQAMDLVRSLQAQPGPWFLTLLSSGTHHPFNVPADFEGEAERDTHRRAAHYLDRAVGRFVELVERSGLRENTLVLITSDESAGLREGDERGRSIAQNWGLAIALTPERDRLDVDAAYSQLDVPLSLLDYLGLRGRSDSFEGRSLFRAYAEPREMVFANTYLRSVGGVDAHGRFFTCDEALVHCSSWDTEPGRMFALPRLRDAPVAADEIAFLRVAAQRSRAPLVAAPTTEFELMRPGRVALAADSERLQWIFGGQNFAVPAGTRIEVELELAVHGRPGELNLIHDFASEGKRFLVRKLPGLRPGERLRLSYRYSTEVPLPTAVVRLWTDPAQPPDPGLELEVARARVRLRPAPPSPAGQPGEVEVTRFELERPG